MENFGVGREFVRAMAWMAVLLALASPATAWAYGGGNSAQQNTGDGGRGSGDGGQGEDLAADFLFGDSRTAHGYGVYRSSFYELGYTFGFMPWLSNDGRGQALASGLTYSEVKGPVINLVMMIVALMGVSDRRYVGSDANYDYYVYDPEGAAAQRRGIMEFFSHSPLSMGVRAYASALGSDVEGFTIDASFQDPIGGRLPVVVWGIGFHVGFFESTSNWRGERFESVWGGGNVDLRIAFFEYLGLWLRVGAWVGGRQEFSLPIELGPEVLIGNRFVIRGLAEIDPVRPEALPDGIGMRLEAGVRL